jgi:hypothetical protein
LRIPELCDRILSDYELIRKESDFNAQGHLRVS